MASLEEINRLAQAATDFQMCSLDGYRMLLIDCFDLCYYHDIELSFAELSFICCPTQFSTPSFEDAGRIPGGRRFIIRAEEGEFEIVAESLAATIGKVFHYDRSNQLQPGERIADWVSSPRS